MPLLSVLVLATSLLLGSYFAQRRMTKRAQSLILALSFLIGATIAVNGAIPLGCLIAASGLAFLIGTIWRSNSGIDPKARPEYRFCPSCSHKLEQRDFEGKAKLACPSCSFVYWNNPIVVGVTLVPSEDGDSVLLVKRGVAPKKGFWCLPGGFGEPNEHPKETAGRETGEEATLDVEIDRLLAVHAAPGSNQVLIFYLAKPTNVKPQPGSDALETRYFRLDDLPADIAFSTHLDVITEWKKAWLARKSA